MSNTPLVSIMMPCYNAHATLPRALASVLAQTFEDWECIVVDDGSDDSPAPIIAQAADPRIRLITLDHNQGRAVARQTALDAARGEYLAMLDADDWMFPTRIADQHDVLGSHSDIALVSSSMAIVDDHNEMVGVRPPTGGGEPRIASFRRLDAPPVVHAPSMIRMSVAKQCTYEPTYAVAEDYDFLIEVLLGRSYATLPTLAYSYRETANLTQEKMLASQAVTRDILRRHRRQTPIRASWLIVQSLIKSAVYRAAFVVGSEQRIIDRRSSPPSVEDIQTFTRARATVEAVRHAVFGPSPIGAEQPDEGTAKSSTARKAVCAE